MNKLKSLGLLRMKKINQNQERLVRKAIAWINSIEGKQAMKDASDQSWAAIEYYRKAREVDLNKIHEPMTI